MSCSERCRCPCAFAGKRSVRTTAKKAKNGHAAHQLDLESSTALRFRCRQGCEPRLWGADARPNRDICGASNIYHGVKQTGTCLASIIFRTAFIVASRRLSGCWNTVHRSDPTARSLVRSAYAQKDVSLLPATLQFRLLEHPLWVRPHSPLTHRICMRTWSCQLTPTATHRVGGCFQQIPLPGRQVHSSRVLWASALSRQHPCLLSGCQGGTPMTCTQASVANKEVWCARRQVYSHGCGDCRMHWKMHA